MDSIKLLSYIEQLIPKIVEMSPFLFIVSLIFLFLPDVYLNSLGLPFFLIKKWAFITLSVLLVLLGSKILNHLIEDSSRDKILKNLSEPEKKILREYVNQGTSSREYSINNGIVTHLCEKGILYLATGLNHTERTIPMPSYNLRSWAEQKFRQKPDYLSCL
ncbi:MAG: super-infection exclusion protein B [Vampirovibrionales bacterium]